MLKIDIPGCKMMDAKHLVLDFNGTLAIDGALIPGVKEQLNALAPVIKIHVVTADTFGKAKDALAGVSCELAILSGNGQDRQKAGYIAGLGHENVIAIGNGRNDALMLKDAAVGILVTQKEGASRDAMLNCDLVCNTIEDALGLLLHPLRLAATLRN